jgi:hypothetical protein
MVPFVQEMQYRAITLVFLAGTSVIRPRRESIQEQLQRAISVAMKNKNQL